MTQVTIVQHVEPEGPGLIARALAAHGLASHLVRVHRGEPIPSSLEGVAGLVVLGGPMGVSDASTLWHLRDEMRLIERALSADLPVLGVCLGSQLLAATLGASVGPGPGKEIGWHSVTLAEPAATDPLLGPVERCFQAFHWHGDAFSLPAGARPLASSELTACQAFRYGRAAYGLLFHLEVDAAQITRMVEVFRDEVVDAGIDPRLIAEDTTRFLPRLEPIGQGVFARWAALARRGATVEPSPGL